MLSLRQRQIDEILDEDKNIYRQVFDREKEQVKVFNEVVAPKSEIDLDTEVKTEQSIEGFKKILEEKVNALENLLGTPTQTIKERSLEILQKTGDLVKQFNDVIRGITNPGIKNATRDITKVKIQEIQPAINTLTYGIPQVVKDFLVSPPVRVGPWLDFQRWLFSNIPRLFTALSVYRIIQRQLFINSFRPIEQNDINTEYSKIIDEYKRQRPNIVNVNTKAELDALNALPADAGKIDVINWIMRGVRLQEPAVNTFAENRMRAIQEEGRQRGIQFSIAERAELRRSIARDPLEFARIQELARENLRRRGIAINPQNMRAELNNTVIPNEIDRILQERARNILDRDILRFSEPIAPTDPATEAQLRRVRAEERQAIEEVARTPTLPPVPEIPPISRTVERDESAIRQLQERQIDEFDGFITATIDAFGIDKIVPQAETTQTIRDLVAMLLDKEQEVYNLSNPAPRTQQQTTRLRNRITAEFENPLIVNRRRNVAERRTFLELLRRLLNAIRANITQIHNKEADELLEDIRLRQSAGVPTTTPTGFGRPRFSNRIYALLPYDDTRNEMYDY